MYLKHDAPTKDFNGLFFFLFYSDILIRRYTNYVVTTKKLFRYRTLHPFHLTRTPLNFHKSLSISIKYSTPSLSPHHSEAIKRMEHVFWRGAALLVFPLVRANRSVPLALQRCLEAHYSVIARAGTVINYGAIVHLGFRFGREVKIWHR